jgi:hypothetical protein
MKYIFAVFVVCVGFASIVSTSSCTKNTVAQTDSLKVGLIAWYPLNNSGADSSGNGNNVMLYNITTSPNRLGVANAAYYFDGTTSYLMAQDNAALRLANTDFTLNAWVNLTSFNQSNGSFVFSKRIAGVNNGWGFSITGVNSGLGIKGAVYFGPGGGNQYALGTKSITLNQWSMLTVEYNAAKQQISIYENGLLDNTTNNISSPSATINAPLYIGEDNPVLGTGYFLNGSLAQLRIYNKALSVSLLQKLYSTSR